MRSVGARHAFAQRASANGMRHAVVLIVAASLSLLAVVQAASFPDVLPERSIELPKDEASHPDYRIEWWYITGWLSDEADHPLGFQVTFFRSRPAVDEENPSQFAAKQLLFAHVAVSDPRRGQLLRAERSARAGFSLAEASENGLEVHIDNWSLRKEGAVYRARILSEQLAMDLEFRPTQRPLLQGRDGFSQKGPDPRSASYYYSLPHLATTGTLLLEGHKHSVQGRAWFDHEWSSAIMDKEASGWDWAGLNLDDGSAVMAFRMRGRQQQEHWAAATWRQSDLQAPRTFAPEEVEWTPLRQWQSPRTNITYPIAWSIRVGGRVLILEPLMDDQENDARGSTGTLYWEGAVRVSDERAVQIGRGYLELTGYGTKEVTSDGVTR